jgi:hypothetical protein
VGSSHGNIAGPVAETYAALKSHRRSGRLISVFQYSESRLRYTLAIVVLAASIVHDEVTEKFIA